MNPQILMKKLRTRKQLTEELLLKLQRPTRRRRKMKREVHCFRMLLRIQKHARRDLHSGELNSRLSALRARKRRISDAQSFAFLVTSILARPSFLTN